MAKTVPSPKFPPWVVVPYSRLVERSNAAHGMAPSPPSKLCRTVKPVPSAFTAKTVPEPALPPSDAVPYLVLPLPATVKPAYELAPSLLVYVPEALVLLAEKLCRVVKVCAVTLPAAIKPRPAISPMAKMANGIPLTEQMARGTRGQVDRL